MRFDNQSAGEGDALLLTAGKLVRLVFCAIGHVDGFEGGQDAAADVGFVDVADIEAEGDIFLDCHVRPEGITLEDHTRITFVGGGKSYVVVAD